MRRLIKLFLVGPALCWAGTYDYYECVGTDGLVTFSVERCAKGEKQRRIADDTAPEGKNLEPRTVKPTTGSLVTENLVMFSTAACGYCKKAKQYMHSKGIVFTEIDIQKDAKGRERYARLGGRGVPFFVQGDKTLTGFSSAKLDAFLGGGS